MTASPNGPVWKLADAADGGFEAGLGQALGILDGHVLRVAVAIVDETAAMLRAPLVQGLFQGVQDDPKARLR